MSNIRKLFFALLLAFLLVPAAQSDTWPKGIIASGFNGTAGNACSLILDSANGYFVTLDGTSLATSSITVAVQVWNPRTAAFQTPTTIGGVTQPITLTNGTMQVINVAGGAAGIQVTISSFGTATGTFTSVIEAY